MTDDKFILMNLDDESSKKVAEAIRNKTSKKILNYLADNKEKSEEDIAKDLGVPINTIEYNLKKLINAKLVEKSANFFWSKKGKKINLYKLANKHIIISPKSRMVDMNLLKTILPVIFAISLIILALIILPNFQEKQTELKKFNSLSELNKFLEDNQVGGRGSAGEIFYSKGVQFASGESEQGAIDYSKTNIQVEGVDEADIIKNDGKNIYVVSGKKVVIVNAFPANDMKILSEINFSDYINGIFINDDKLVVFESQYSSPIIYNEVRCMAIGCPPIKLEERTFVYIYDISNKKNPSLENNISVSGSYVNSRMIEDYIYLITNQYAYPEGILPSVIKNGRQEVIKANEISYSPIKDHSFQFTNILAINIDDGDTSEKTVLTGFSQTIYVSKNNIYTTYTSYPYYWGIAEKDGVEQVEQIEKTIINRFSIDRDKIKFISSGEVSGHLLNQFSMDENEDYFRIATTISKYVDNRDLSTNNLYVLNKDLKVVGKIEEIAPGESIYAVRFMGDRAYMITFKQVDPLFVIGLEDPKNPVLLGKLKIPGYSEYLHPYDETHLIGVGKEVDESIDADKVHTEGAIYYTAIQGVKLAIFDVSDVNNPVEIHKEIIGDRGSMSPVGTEHKAFLFDKKKNLLVIPVTVAELKPGQPKSELGEFVFQGAYVYNIDLEQGFNLKGKITHYKDNDDVFKKTGYYFYGDEKSISRSLYIDNVLYTFSLSMIKSNNLDDLKEINSVKLPYEVSDYYKPYPNFITVR